MYTGVHRLRVRGGVHTPVLACTPRRQPLSGPVPSPGPPYLPETVEESRELRQRIFHRADDVLHSLLRGRPAGVREPLEQGLGRDRAGMSGPALQGKGCQTHTHTHTHTHMQTCTLKCRASPGVGAPGLPGNQGRARLTDGKGRWGLCILLRGQPAVAPSKPKPSACPEVFSTAPHPFK